MESGDGLGVYSKCNIIFPIHITFIVWTVPAKAKGSAHFCDIAMRMS